MKMFARTQDAKMDAERRHEALIYDMPRSGRPELVTALEDGPERWDVMELTELSPFHAPPGSPGWRNVCEASFWETFPFLLFCHFSS